MTHHRLRIWNPQVLGAPGVFLDVALCDSASVNVVRQIWKGSILRVGGDRGTFWDEDALSVRDEDEAALDEAACFGGRLGRERV